MCTASWLKRDGTLHLFFNRDELLTREAGLPPARFESGGVVWIAPRDGRAGGTWIAATAHGAALALLNRSAGRQPRAAISRGRLLPNLIGAERPEQLDALLATLPLARFAPFRLVALFRGEADGRIASWDGMQLEAGEVSSALGLLCSSGLGDEQATAARSAVWERMRAETEAWGAARHAAFHCDHTPRPSSLSVCMHRDDAATVSYTEIEISAHEAILRYFGTPPCVATSPGVASVQVGSTRALLGA